MNICGGYSTLAFQIELFEQTKVDATPILVI